MTKASKTISSFIPALTGMRAIAAGLVYFHHFGMPIFPGIPRGVFTLFTRECHVGVEFFFVLSGFVITYRNFANSYMNLGWLRNYVQNRVARIYPVYFLLTLITYLILHSIGSRPGIFELLVNFSLTKGLFNDFKFSGISQGWTLSVEELFYLSAPLFFWLIKKHRWWILPWLVPLLGILLVQIPWNFHGFFENLNFLLTYTFFGSCLEFFFGMALAILVLKYRQTPEKLRLTKFSIYSYIGILGVSLSIYTLTQLVSDPQIIADVQLTGQSQSGWFTSAGIFVTNIILPFFITVFYAGLILEQTFLKRLLSSKLLVLLGESSYVFYLVQAGAIRDLTVKHLGLENWIGDLFVIISASILIHKLIESPATNFLRSRNL